MDKIKKVDPTEKRQNVKMVFFHLIWVILQSGKFYFYTHHKNTIDIYTQINVTLQKQYVHFRPISCSTGSYCQSSSWMSFNNFRSCFNLCSCKSATKIASKRMTMILPRWILEDTAAWLIARKWTLTFEVECIWACLICFLKVKRLSITLFYF